MVSLKSKLIRSLTYLLFYSVFECFSLCFSVSTLSLCCFLASNGLLSQNSKMLFMKEVFAFMLCLLTTIHFFCSILSRKRNMKGTLSSLIACFQYQLEEEQLFSQRILKKGYLFIIFSF